MIYVGLELNGLIQQFRIGLLLSLLASCSFQTSIPSGDEAARNIVVNTNLQCLQEKARIIKSNSRVSSRVRSAPPALIRLHGKKDSLDSFQAHITIEPNGMLIEHLSDLEQSDTNLGADTFIDQGLHIQILDEADLTLNAPISDAQYSALALQLLIWQVKHGIPVARITSENTSLQARSIQDLQVRLNWVKLKSQMNKLTKTCR